MDLERWRAASPWLEQALELPAAERDAWLDGLERERPAVAADVRRLLAGRDATGFGAFMARPLGDLAESQRMAGRRLGPYLLEHEVGRGGMGVVWRARRDDGRFEGHVALKFLRSAWLGRAGLARFQGEGALLARLDHPHVARLLDAGVTGDGDPYLVLEYVEGVPIDAYCDAARLDVEARLRLFLGVLDAVAAAHAQLIVHRDLKPSNVLVTGDGRAKLLDFGVAKLLVGDDPGLTRDAGNVLTPAYAAPEQLRGEPPVAATDVYALGLLLYLLLTGRQPQGALATGSAEYARVASGDATIAPPSTVAATVPEATAGARASTAPRLQRRLRGDLDTVLGRALAPRAADRYPSAAAFADDLRRHLAHVPVVARPPTLGYRAGRFVRRNRLAVGSASVLALALLAGVAGTAWQASEARRERDRALALLDRNESLVEFVNTMLMDAARADESLSVQQLLERSRLLVTGEPTGDPAGDAAVLLMLARFWATLGDANQAAELAALGAQRVGTVGDPALRAQLLCVEGYAVSLQGKADAARDRLERGLAFAGADPVARYVCLQQRAYVAQNANDPATALRDAEAALALLRRSGRSTPLSEGTAIGNVAYAQYLRGDALEADRRYAEAAAVFRSAGRERTALYVTLLNNWGIASFSAGDPRRGLASYDGALRVAEQLSPAADPPGFLVFNRGLARLTLAQYESAVADLQRTVAIGERTGNPTLVAASRAALGYALHAQGEPARGAAELAAARAMVGREVPADATAAVTVDANLGAVALLDGRWAEARAAYDRIIAFFDARGMRVGPVVSSLRGRAETWLAEGEVVAARADLERALPLARELQGGKPASVLTGTTLTRLAELQRLEGDLATAARTAAEAVAQLTEAVGADHPETRRAREAAGS